MIFNVGQEFTDMTDAIILVAVISIGTFIWGGIQTVAWLCGLHKGVEFATARGLLLGALIGFPIFVLIVGALRGLVGSETPIWDYIIAPIVVAYAVALSILGLYLARRILSARHKNTTAQQAVGGNRR